MLISKKFKNRFKMNKQLNLKNVL